uniref:Uncharacterized protein n=1 Tax=Setaria viridis TaxID=4556 RepID=A0A4U6SZV9_SETVI|nr:hypothetical protein SEVIR_9G244400v2 [Setaria viridis]
MHGIIYSVFFCFQFISPLCAKLWKGEERMTKEWQIKAATSEQAQLVLWQCSAGVII